MAVLLLIPLVWCWNCGESFLSVTRRLPAEVLVVEGWIGRNGIRAARTEFDEHRYQYIITTGGMTSGFWEDGLSNYAEMAAGELLRLGVPTDKIIVAPTMETENNRTFESAIAVRPALEARGIHPKTLNVFTFGPHAHAQRFGFRQGSRAQDECRGRRLAPTQVQSRSVVAVQPAVQGTPWGDHRLPL
jgi:hypothetical protein